MSARSETILRFLFRHPVGGGSGIILLGILTLLREVRQATPQPYIPIGFMVFGLIIVNFGDRIGTFFDSHLSAE